MREVHVSGSQHGSYGIKYDLAYDDTREYAGSVEVTPLKNMTVYSVRDRFFEPVMVGSPRYTHYVEAVKALEDATGE